MATVLKGYDPRFKRGVAIKLLPREFLHDPQFRARFHREAQTIAALEHPAIVPVYDFGDADGQLYLVMRLMTGGSLADRLEKGPLSIIETARIFERLAPALDSAHALGIIHRDLKPANILFDQWNNPYLSDFGIAKLVAGSSTALTATGGLVGTPAYMSPEQVRGVDVLDGRSDIYAMGVILFQMLTGQLPYNANTPIGLAFMHVTEPIPNILEIDSTLPDAYQSVIGQAMAKEREARPRTAAELAGTISGLVLRKDKSFTTFDSDAKETIVDPLPDKVETEQLEIEVSKTSNTTNLPLTALESELHQEKHGQNILYQEPYAGNLPQPFFRSDNSIIRRIPVWGWVASGFVVFVLIFSLSVLLSRNSFAAGTTATPNNLVVLAEVTEIVSKTPTLFSVSVVQDATTPEFTKQPSGTSTTQPTRTASHMPKPTNTPTRMPRPTSTVTKTPVPNPQVRVVYSSANVRIGPGAGFESIDVLTQDDIVDVLAMTNDGTWYNVILGSGTLGWISAAAVDDVQNMDMISIVETIPASQAISDQVTDSGWAEECDISWQRSSDGFYQMYPSLHTAQNSTVYGEGPITFSWPACSLPYGYFYRLIVSHIGIGSYTNVYEATTNSLTISLPLEKHGAWEWEIEVIKSNGDVATYLLPDNSKTYNVSESSIGFFYDPYSSP